MTSVTEVRSANARLFASRRRPLVSVITTLYYVVIISNHRVCYRTLSLCNACIRTSGIILTPKLPLCQISFLSWPPLLREPMEKKSHTQSLNHSPSLIDAPGTKISNQIQTTGLTSNYPSISVIR